MRNRHLTDPSHALAASATGEVAGLAVAEAITKYVAEVTATLAALPLDAISRAVAVLHQARMEGKMVFVFGNGGSAATASHFACDLAKGAHCPGRPRFKALALTDNLPVFSAWANDSSYEHVFAEQLENFVGPGDVVVAISGSGNSANVLKGVAVARGKGATAIGFAGFDGGKLGDMVDLPVIVPNCNLAQVEDVHLLLEHVITTCLRNGGADLRSAAWDWVAESEIGAPTGDPGSSETHSQV